MAFEGEAKAVLQDMDRLEKRLQDFSAGGLNPDMFEAAAHAPLRVVRRGVIRFLNRILSHILRIISLRYTLFVSRFMSAGESR